MRHKTLWCAGILLAALLSAAAQAQTYDLREMYRENQTVRAKAEMSFEFRFTPDPQEGAPAPTEVVISMANALAKVGHEFQPLVPPRGSVAASVQAAVPKSLVAAGFHHVPAKELGDLDHPVESDVLICSDHPSATETASEIVRKLVDMRPLDAGELSNAAPIEAFAAVLLQLNVRYKTRAAVKFTGIDE